MPIPERQQQERRERRQLLRQFEHMLELPMVVLGFVWLALLVFDLTVGLGPFWQALSTTIWIIFVFDFALSFFLAPAKGDFLRTHWLVALSLAVPGVRVLRLGRALRFMRLARAVRAVRFARVLAAVNRGLRSLRATMRRRGLGYVVGLTAIVAFAGAAGMYAFEQDGGQRAGFDTYGSALWWTLMLLTSIGSEYWPKTGSGRALCLLLSVYGFAVFGYITAALASYFVGRDVEKKAEASRGPASAQLPQ